MHLTYNAKGCYRVPRALAPGHPVFDPEPPGQFEHLCSYHPGVTKCWELPLLQAIVAYSIWFREWVGVGQHQLFHSFPITEFKSSERPGHPNRTIQVNGTFHGYDYLIDIFSIALHDLAARGWISVVTGIHPGTDTYEGGEEPVYLPTTQLFTELWNAHDQWRDTWMEDYRLLPDPPSKVVIASLTPPPIERTPQTRTPQTRAPRAKGGDRECISEGVYPLIVQEALLGLPPIPDDTFHEAVRVGTTSLTTAEQLILSHLIETTVREGGWCWLTYGPIVGALRAQLAALPPDAELSINSPLMRAMKAIRLLREAQLVRTQRIKAIDPNTGRAEPVEVLSGDLGLMQFVPDPRPD